MYNSRVYSQNVIRPIIVPSQNGTPISAPVHQYPQFKEISPQANSAICAYMSPVINRDSVPQIPLRAMINRLKMQGKIEGKDFNVEKFECGNVVLSINNKLGQKEKCVYYHGGDTDRWSEYEEKTYKGNKLLRSTVKNNKGKTFLYTNYHYNNEIPQSTFKPDGLAECQTADEYVDYLKANNVNYKIEYRGRNKVNKEITEFNDKNRKTQSTIWTNDELFSINKYDKNGSEIQRIDFLDNHTEVTNYPEKRVEFGEFPTEDFPQENFTDDGITYKTSPKAYINLLKNSGRNFKIYKINNGKHKSINIKEFNSNGDEKLFTVWDFSDKEQHCIFQEKYKSNGDRIRVEVNKNNTHVEKFTS